MTDCHTVARPIQWKIIAFSSSLEEKDRDKNDNSRAVVPRQSTEPPYWTPIKLTLYLVKMPTAILCLSVFPVFSLFVVGGSSQKHTNAGCKHSTSWRSDVRRNIRTITDKVGWPTFDTGAVESEQLNELRARVWTNVSTLFTKNYRYYIQNIKCASGRHLP